jgi:RNA polymerase sigma factor (sigma-70 family)
MTRSEAQFLQGSLDTLWAVGELGAMTDGELLDHFQAHRDTSGQDAFRILVQRHGPMVLGLCRSLLRDPNDAEDAFQATFLVLVRRADSIRKRATLGPWLCGVTYRVARRARVRSVRRRRHEVAAVAELAGPSRADHDSTSTGAAIQEEIARLPESFRAPLVLCCLEGLSYDLAARRLGVSEPTLRGRLHRARKRLAARLRGRGVLAPVVARLTEPAGLNVPSLPASLVESTIQLASRWSSVSGLLVGAGAVPESIAALARGVIHAMILQTVKSTGIAVLLGAGVLATVVVAQQGRNPAADSAAQPAGTSLVLAQKKRPPGPQPREQPNPGDLQRKTQEILQRLEEPIAMNFPNEIPLNQVLKYIKQATTTPTFSGIPIYVEPLGLQEANRSLDSTIQFDRADLPLKTSLRLILKPLGLSYMVKDGFLMIDSRSAITETRVEEVERKLDRILEALERLERSK